MVLWDHGAAVGIPQRFECQDSNYESNDPQRGTVLGEQFDWGGRLPKE